MRSPEGQEPGAAGAAKSGRSMGLGGALNFRAGFWRLADPKISMASIASMALGAASAAAEGPISAGWLAVTVLGILSLEVAKNASGEIVDFDSGTDQWVRPEDRSPFSGGKRVLVEGLLTRRQTVWISLVAYVLGVGLGLVIVVFREPSILGLGIAGVALAYFYHGPPFKLAYRGLGEIAVGLCYGPMIAVGTFLVQTHHVDREVALSSVPLGLLIMAFLWINEFPDHAADQRAGKRTLVVRFGPKVASWVFGGIVGTAFGVLALLPLLGVPGGVWLGFVGALPIMEAGQTLQRSWHTTQGIIPAQRQVLLGFVLYALGAGLGLVSVRLFSP